MKPKNRIIDYLLITGFAWGLYLTWLIPFQLWWVGMNWSQFTTWIIWGTILEMIVSYPTTKLCIRVCPKITRWVETL